MQMRDALVDKGVHEYLERFLDALQRFLVGLDGDYSGHALGARTQATDTWNRPNPISAGSLPS
jgi:hypothetical protein